MGNVMQSKSKRESIEFLYGPFDGHVEYTRSQCDDLPGELLVLVNENSYRLIEKQPPVPSAACSSIAIYDRVRRNGTWVYLFICVLSTEKITQACAEVGLRFGTAERIDRQ